MGVPTSEVGYTSVTTGRGDNEVYKERVVALEKKNISVLTESSLLYLTFFILGRVFITREKH
jgi:hypothetical protein